MLRRSGTLVAVPAVFCLLRLLAASVVFFDLAGSFCPSTLLASQRWGNKFYNALSTLQLIRQPDTANYKVAHNADIGLEQVFRDAGNVIFPNPTLITISIDNIQNFEAHKMPATVTIQTTMLVFVMFGVENRLQMRYLSNIVHVGKINDSCRCCTACEANPKLCLIATTTGFRPNQNPLYPLINSLRKFQEETQQQFRSIDHVPF